MDGVLLLEGNLIPLPEVMGYFIGSLESSIHISSPEAGAFVQFLIREYGIEKFRSLYQLVTKGGPPNIPKNVEILELIYGKNFSEF